jgi:Zn-dependent protease with chaperone function
MSITKSLYALAGTALVAENTFAAGINFTKNDPVDLKGGNDQSALAGITRVITNLLGLVTLVAVAYCLYAGFQIMTAGGDEEKVKSGRKTIINVIIGIVVMWLSYFIVTFIVNTLVG